ncbi:uncharacterized protein LOC142320635 [Lycorma delicatula]|uniref:uncharacterized protein LOC142320635 n=1 Tax=Lycorma delicatula TaxID=130591 RepID=UPI003F50F95B
MTSLLERKSDLLDTKIPLLTRIKFPRIWKRLPNGIRIEDLQESKFNETLDHIKNFYLKDEALCNLSKISKDTESVENFLKLIRWWMQDTQSLVAITEDTEKIVGVLIQRVLDLYLMKTFSRVMNYNGNSLQKMQKFLIRINKAIDINKIYNVHNYNQIFIWSVDPSYRNKGIGKALLQSSIAQTKTFNLSIVTGVFTSNETQTIARNEGFHCLYEQAYNSWKEKSQIIFGNIGFKNSSAKLMVFNLNNADCNVNVSKEIMQKNKISQLCVLKTITNKVKK